METTVTKSAAFKKLCKSFKLDHNEIPEIISFEDACKSLGRSTALPDVSMLPKKHQQAVIATYKLFTITEALNEGWEPNWNNWDEYKYYPWFDVKASDKAPGGSGLSCDGYDGTHSYTIVGSRLCTRTRTIAKYAGMQFRTLYEEAFLIR